MAADREGNNLDFATAMTDHVTVGRSLTAESGGVIAAYSITTNGETERAVTVEVRDFLPNWGIDEIDFHPEFAPDEGSISENKVAFRSEVTADETRVVKYGVALSTSEPVEVVARQQSLSPPRVTEVDAPGGDDADATEAPAEPTGEPDAGADALLFGEDREDEPQDDDTANEPASPDEPPADDPPVADPLEPSTADDEESVPDGRHAEDGLVGALLGEIERGAVSDAQLAALREALGAGTSTSVDVRLRHVHARMEEFAAYTDALRELLDEGDVEAVAEVRGEVDDLRSEVEALREAQRAADERLEAVEAAVETLESEMADGFEEVRAELDAAGGEGASAREIEELRNAVNVLARDMEERFEDLWATIDTVNRAGESAADAIN